MNIYMVKTEIFSVENLALIFSLVAIIISSLSLVLQFVEAKPKLVFSAVHISPWNKNQIVFYSKLKILGIKILLLKI